MEGKINQVNIQRRAETKFKSNLERNIYNQRNFLSLGKSKKQDEKFQEKMSNMMHVAGKKPNQQ